MTPGKSIAQLVRGGINVFGSASDEAETAQPQQGDGVAFDGGMSSSRAREDAVVAADEDEEAIGVGSEQDGEIDVDTEEDGEIDFDDEKLLNGIGMPLFMLDTDREVIAWSDSMADLTGVSEAAAKQSADVASVVYPGGDRTGTLADQVLDHPESAHEHSEATLANESLSIYETECALTDRDGAARHYECSARPLYQEGELTAVLQTIQDRTVEVKRHESISGLVEELRRTFQEIADGSLDARAEFMDEDDVIDRELLTVVDDVNEMADELESLVERVDSQTGTLAEIGEQSTEKAHQIDSHISKQLNLLDDVGEDLEDFSANMQEVAANADQIASASEKASDAAQDGREASERARTATDAVLETSDHLVDTVQRLEQSIDEIEEVLNVINDVAEQTNILALNASIESAHAGEAGDGFGVVADEIKELARETREHTEAIEQNVNTIQDQADTATGAVEDSHEQVQQTSTEIETALSSLEEIASAVDEATTGIQEVARANDAQADTVQDLLGMVDQTRDHATDVKTGSSEIVSLLDEQQGELGELQERVRSLNQGT